MFNSPVKDEILHSDLPKHINHVKNISLKSSSYLNHLLKDYQFMVKLTDEDVSVAKTDIDYLKSGANQVINKVEQHMKEGQGIHISNPVELLNKTETDLLAYYIDSIKRLSKTITLNYKKVRQKDRGIDNYSFVELIAKLSEKSDELKNSKNSCVNTLKLKAGDDFGYNLQLNIEGSFTDPHQARLVKEIQGYSFLYPINYSMILNGEMLPDIKLIKSHLFKEPTLGTKKIDAITIINDPYDELEKVLPVTEVLKAEISSSTEYIQGTEKYIKESLNAFIVNGNSDTGELVSTLNDRIKKLNHLITTLQNDRIGLSEEAMDTKFPNVDRKNYITLNSFIYRRLVFLKEILDILVETYSRSPATIHPFNWDVLKASLMKTSNPVKS